ncbi:MAG: hypothetical protein K2P17_03970 [Helicobacteraceae bacterium]|nr:hypothetical protein [Helicobacteraceae bacterium]
MGAPRYPIIFKDIKFYNNIYYIKHIGDLPELPIVYKKQIVNNKKLLEIHSRRIDKASFIKYTEDSATLTIYELEGQLILKFGCIVVRNTNYLYTAPKDELKEFMEYLRVTESEKHFNKKDAKLMATAFYKLSMKYIIKKGLRNGSWWRR